MVACTIRFFTRTASSSQTETASGFLRRTEEGYSVSYRLSGDQAHLVVTHGKLSMERKGEFTLSARFVLEQDSPVFTDFKGLKGEIPVHTEALRISEHPGRLGISLDYRICGTYPEQISLKIFISFLEAL